MTQIRINQPLTRAFEPEVAFQGLQIAGLYYNSLPRALRKIIPTITVEASKPKGGKFSAVLEMEFDLTRLTNRVSHQKARLVARFGEEETFRIETFNLFDSTQEESVLIPFSNGGAAAILRSSTVNFFRSLVYDRHVIKLEELPSYLCEFLELPVTANSSHR